MAVWSNTSLAKVLQYDRIDGEYFLPIYLENDRKLSAIATFSLPDKFSVSDGNHMSVSHWFSDSGDVPYYRGQDVNDFFLENATPVRIPHSIYDSGLMQRSHFREGDVLLSIVGTIGSLSVVPKGIGEATGSCKIAILRAKSAYRPFALAAFLATKYGQLQIKRNTRGAVQMGLILRDLSRIRIPDFPDDILKEIDFLVKMAIKKNHDSKVSYTSARSLLLGALKEENLKFECSLSYTAQFSDVMREGRTDAEFFHAKYQPLLDLIQHYPSGFDCLGEISRRVEPNFSPDDPLGMVNYTEIGDVDISNGRYAYNQIAALALPANAKIRLRGGELLISTVRPTRGAIAIADDKLPEGVNVCSGAFYVCDIADKSRREVIWLYLRTVKHLFEKYCGGTSYPTIDAAYLRDFPIPRFDKKLSGKVKSLIKRSKEAAKESEILLASAKARVEELIEEATK